MRSNEKLKDAQVSNWVLGFTDTRLEFIETQADGIRYLQNRELGNWFFEASRQAIGFNLFAEKHTKDNCTNFQMFKMQFCTSREFLKHKNVGVKNSMIPIFFRFDQNFRTVSKMFSRKCSENYFDEMGAQIIAVHVYQATSDVINGVKSKSPKLKSPKSKFSMSKSPKLLNEVIGLRN